MRRTRLGILAIGLVGVAACSGGGGDSSPTAATAPVASTVPPTTAAATTTTPPTTLPATTTTMPPVAVDAPCPGGVAGRCGTVTVPLDRAHPEKGTIDIYFVLASRDDTSQPAAGTLLGMTGGPGGEGTSSPGAWLGWAAASGPYDVLLTDYRGTGRSGVLRCAAAEQPPFPLEIEAARDTVQSCGEELGDKASLYDTAATADDIEAVRTALGLGPVDVLGISYGTYVAQVYAARHPDAVRSVTLDGAVPLAAWKGSTGPGYNSVIQLRAAVTALQSTCQRGGACSPDGLVADLATVAQQVRTAPAGGQPDIPTLEAMLLDPSVQPALPAALRAAAAGDRSRLEQLAATWLQGRSSTATGPVESFSPALAASIACNDFQGDFDSADRTAREAQVAKELTALSPDVLTPFTGEEWSRLVDGGNGYRSLCVGWPVSESASGDEQAAPLPKVPVLVMNGDIDLLTPFEGAKQAAADWPGAIFVGFPNVPHTPLLNSACAPTVLKEFLTTLKVANPDVCATATPPPSVDA